MALKRMARHAMRTLLRDRERFELWAGLTFFTAGLLLFLAGWTVWQHGAFAWSAVPAALAASFGLLGLSGKVPLSALVLNRGFAAYEPKRGGQLAVAYGAGLFGLGVFALSSLPYAWLEPSGSYGLAALLGASLILGGLYIVASTPVLEPATPPHFETDDLAPAEPVPWYVIEDEPAEAAAEAPRLLPRGVEPRYAVPQVKPAAAAKRPSMLAADDIVAYAFIECDWVETPGDYTCVTVADDAMAPVVDAGDVVGINHAMADPLWLRGKLVAAYAENQRVVFGFLQEAAAGGWQLAPRNEGCEAIEVQPVAIIGAVEWSLKPGSKSIQPAGDSAEPPAFESRLDG